MRWPFSVVLAAGLFGMVGVAGLHLAVTRNEDADAFETISVAAEPTPDPLFIVPAGAEPLKLVADHRTNGENGDDRPVWPVAFEQIANGCRTAVANGPADMSGPVLLCSDEAPAAAAVAERPEMSADEIHPPALSAPGSETAAEEDEPGTSVVSRIVERELPAASDDEQRVWAEELRGLDPATARELLRLRRQIGSVGNIRTAHVPGLLPGLPTENPFDGVTELPHRDPLPVPLPPHLTERMTETSAPHSDPLAPTLSAFDQARLVLLNNMANAATPGFKRLQVLFEDQPYARLESYGDGAAANGALPTLIGHGIAVAATQLDLTQGEITASSQPLDLAIDGDGFFELRHEDETLYTRVGRFTRSADGVLMFVSGRVLRELQPTISIPVDAQAIEISPEGMVRVTRPGADEPLEVGQIRLTRFANPSLLIPVGGCLFDASAAGEPLTGPPATGGRGPLRQRALEASNVNLEVELAQLEQLEHHRRLLCRAAALQSASPPESLATKPEGGRPSRR